MRGVAYFILLFFFMSESVLAKAQNLVWLFDGSIIKVDTVFYDSTYAGYVYTKRKKSYILEPQDIFAITAPHDTIIVNDTILPVDAGFKFLQGLHDGLNKSNFDKILLSTYLSVFSNFLLKGTNSAVRGLPNFILFVGSAVNSGYQPDWDTPAQAYAEGFKLGQMKRAPADIAIGTVVGSYISISVLYLMFEK